MYVHFSIREKIECKLQVNEELVQIIIWKYICIINILKNFSSYSTVWMYILRVPF